MKVHQTSPCRVHWRDIVIATLITFLQAPLQEPADIERLFNPPHPQHWYSFVMKFLLLNFLLLSHHSIVMLHAWWHWNVAFILIYLDRKQVFCMWLFLVVYLSGRWEHSLCSRQRSGTGIFEVGGWKENNKRRGDF